MGTADSPTDYTVARTAIALQHKPFVNLRAELALCGLAPRSVEMASGPLVALMAPDPHAYLVQPQQHGLAHCLVPTCLATDATGVSGDTPRLFNLGVTSLNEVAT